jgi:peptidoglycan/LPS O-acetylase OafA/YrhL
MNAKTEQGRFIGLDGLRGVAAIAVFACHVPDKSVFNILPNSYLGVDLFFILSGFVLTHAYANSLKSGLGVVDFMRLRLVRLYPLYLLGTLIAGILIVLLILRGRSFDPIALASTLLTAILFLPTPPEISINPRPLYPLNPPAYSLFLELAVNLTFAVLARRLNTFVLIALVMLSLAGMLQSFRLAGTMSTGDEYDFWLFGFPRVAFSFFVGVGLYRIWRSDWLAWLKPPSWLPMAALVCVFALRGDPALVEFVSSVLLLPAIVLASANTVSVGNFAWLCLLLGQISYPFYVLQVPLIHGCELGSRFFFGHDLGAFGIAGSIVVAGLLTTAALISVWTYDTPIRRRLMGKAVRRREVARGEISQEHS